MKVRLRPCPTCSGEGLTYSVLGARRCWTCSGRGFVRKRREDRISRAVDKLLGHR